MSTFIFSYYSITFWYPTFLRSLALPPLRYLIALTAGGLIGSVILGQLSETRLGRRGAPTLGMLVGVLAAPLYLWCKPASRPCKAPIRNASAGVWC